jgi:hypothetical protein
MWHKVETVEPGVSINISLMGMNYATLVCQALQHLLLKETAWRETIVGTPPGSEAASKSSPSVTEKLELLLNGLPDVIRKLGSGQAGAQSILPPVLRHPPSFRIDDDSLGDDKMNSDQLFDDENSSGSNEIDDHKPDDEDDNENASTTLTDATPHEDDVMDSDDQIIDVECFEDPNGWSGKQPSKDCCLRKNPLASVMKMSEIVGYYGRKHSKSADDDNSQVYVLNVNFAGNEMQESAVRVLLRETGEHGILQTCVESESEGIDPSTRLTPTLVSSTRKSDDSGRSKILDCLLFHGYFHWITQ